MIFNQYAKAAALLFLVMITSGCAALVKPDVAEKTGLEAELAVARILELNEAVPTYKSIGEVSVRTPRDAWTIRAAWAASPDGRFRIEALGLAGQSLAKMICDEDACHFLFSEEGCYRIIESKSKNLDPLTGVDADVGDLILLLGGGIPIYPHQHSWIEMDQETGGKTLILASRWGRPVEKLFFYPGETDVHKIEVYGWRGLRYRAQIESMHIVDGHRQPGVLLIEKEEDAMLQVRVERSWAEVPLSENLFVPELPEARRCE